MIPHSRILCGDLTFRASLLCTKLGSSTNKLAMGRDLLRFSSNKKYGTVYYVGENLNATRIRIPKELRVLESMRELLGHTDSRDYLVGCIVSVKCKCKWVLVMNNIRVSDSDNVRLEGVVESTRFRRTPREMDTVTIMQQQTHLGRSAHLKRQAGTADQRR